MNELYYIYPLFKSISFTRIAKEHIAQLKKTVKIQEIDEGVLDVMMWLGPKKMLLHPILYAIVGHNFDMYDYRIKRLHKLRRVRGKLGGFETADSDAISKKAADVLNKVDLCFVPTTFAKETYEKSGVQIPVEVIPHGVSETFCSPSKEITSNQLSQLVDIKQNQDAVLILFFCLHSAYRKGADILLRAMEMVQQTEKHIYLVVKRGMSKEPIIDEFRKLRMIEIKGWFDDNILRQLYDACDIMVVPSRGGGFELNALEGLARGKPTIVPRAGCFLDYVDYAVPVDYNKQVKVFSDNPIHNGNGFEVSPRKLADSIIQVVSELNHQRKISEENSLKVRSEYSWKTICEKLKERLVKHGFIDG